MRILSFLLILLPFVGFTQASDSLKLRADSLERQLPVLPDEKKIETLRWLAAYNTHTNADKATQLLREAITVAKRNGYEKLNALHTSQIFVFVIVGQYDSAEYHFQQALALTPEEDPLRSTIYMNAGSLYLRAGQYSKALSNYHLAQEIAERSDNQQQLMRIYVNTAVVYEVLKNYTRAITYDSLGYNLALKLNNKSSANVALSNLGEHLQQKGMLREALAVFKKAEKNSIGLPASEYSLALIYGNMASVKLKMNNPDSGIYYALKSLRLFEQQHSESHIAGLHRMLSEAELKRNNIQQAEKYARQAHASATERKVDSEIKPAAFLLMKIYLKKNDADQAALYEREYLALTDSLEQENQAKAVLELQTKYDTEKRDQENQLLKYNQQLQDVKLNRQKQIITYAVTMLLVVALMLVWVFRSYRQKRKTNADLQKTLQELRETQTQLIHSEKMVSLGQMTAGIAHEINNPLTFIATGITELEYTVERLKKIIKEYEALTAENFKEQFLRIDEVKNEQYYNALWQEMDSMIEAIKIGAHRTTSIIQNLQRFSRKETVNFERKDIAEVIEETLVLIHGEAKHKIEIIKNYPQGIYIECRPVEIGQVFMNLFLNAIYAMQDGGRMTITLVQKEQYVEAVVADTGTGIRPEIISKIFDPFFTTKDIGKGTGLGLSVSHGIIKSHRGEITVKSELNVGTSFTIHLPIKQPAA